MTEFSPFTTHFLHWTLPAKEAGKSIPTASINVALEAFYIKEGV